MAEGAGGLDDRRLDQLRQVGDPVADELAAELLHEHPGLDERALVRLVLDHIGPTAPGTNDHVRRWMTDGPPLPDWAELDRICAGQEFFGDWPLPIATALFCVSLPGAYAAAAGSRVLTMTSDLATGNLARRAVETGQMLFDVMDMGRSSPDSLQPGGRGYLTIRGVRLLHAVVRQTVLAANRAGLNPDADPGGWSAAWGQPVNQEDLLGTLLTFTVAVFHGLDRLGIPYDRGAADDYLHTWCVIGHLIGIRPGLLPVERTVGEDLARLIARRHHRESDAGLRLTASLLHYMEVSMPLGLHKLPRTLMRRMLPPGLPDMLGVPPAAWWHGGLDAIAWSAPLLARLPGEARLVQAPSAVLGRAFLRMVVERTLDGQLPPFRLDPQVADQLSLRTSHVRHTMRRRRHRIRQQQAQR
jgi:hypothetical protein